MTHDYAAQKAETFRVFNELTAEHALPDVADLDIFLIPASAEADWVPLARVLEENEFLCDWVDDDEDAKEDGPYLLVTLPDQPISAQSIWIAEELATKLALEHGFEPDGWGLEG